MKSYILWICLVLITNIVPLVCCAGDEDTREKVEQMFPLLDLFASSIAIVENDYAVNVSATNLIYGALHGMLRSLDPHSEFMEPEDLEQMKVETEGKFGGIGIEIGFRDDYPVVIAPIEDTPAFAAGLMPNDRIVKIGDISTRGMSLGDAVKLLRGEPGTEIQLTIQRNFESIRELKEIRITRTIIKVTKIRDAHILDPTNGIGYVRVTSFGLDTHIDLQNAMDGLATQGMKSVIVDLRNNGGGLLKEAIDMSDIFLVAGKLIVSTKGRIEQQNKEYYATTSPKKHPIPLALLVNGASASASEIVCGAIKDNRRGIVVGIKTFGKGSVQTVIPIGDNNCALRLTTAKYYTPSGVCIHGTGIYPTIEVKIPLEDEIKLIEKRSSAYKNYSAESATEKEKSTYEELRRFRDVQLDRAVDVLVALDFMKTELK